MTAKLVFLSGSRAGTEVVLGQEPITIGRQQDRSIVYAPDEQLVSSRHATIRYEGGHYILHDDGSMNGTFVNDDRVMERELRDGDTIHFGLGGPSARFAAPGAVSLPRTAPVAKGGTVTRLLRDAKMAASAGEKKPGVTMVMKEFGRLVYQQSSRRARRGMLLVAVFAAVAIVGVIIWAQRQNRQIQANLQAADRAHRAEVARLQEEARHALGMQRQRESEVDSLLSRTEAELSAARRSSQEEQARLHGEISAERSASAQEQARMKQTVDSLRALKSDRERFQAVAAANQASLVFVYSCQVYTRGNDVRPMCGSGTGFVIDDRGDVITNKHVIQPWKFEPEEACFNVLFTAAKYEMKGSFVAVWPAGQRFRGADGKVDFRTSFNTRDGNLVVVGTAPDDMRPEELPCEVGTDRFTARTQLHVHGNNDLALLRVTTATSLVPVRTAPSMPAILDPVMAFGFPLGDMPLEGAVAQAQPTLGEVRKIEETIQHTAYLAGGNSGGPLYNINGEVIGINTSSFVAGGAQAFNTAIKIEYALRLLQTRP